METQPVRAATLDRLGDVVKGIDGVHLRHLPPCTILLIRTINSLYRVVVTKGPEVRVQGGAFFPDATSAYLAGATIGGSCIKVGWIGVGLLVEFRLGRRRIVTSPVRAIAMEHAPGSVTC